MPPRKRGRGKAATPNAKRLKKGQKEEDPDPIPPLQKDESFGSKLKRIYEEEKGNSPKNVVFKVDKTFVERLPGKKISIHEDFACMLNQTNIGQNNNKFYVIQIGAIQKKFHLFTKWGRVGESGNDETKEFTSADEAKKSFKKKFKDKTKNDWEKRADFTPVPGKYTMLEMSQESDDEEEDIPDSKQMVKASPLKSLTIKCNLDARTQLLIKLIFNDDMFIGQMTAMNLDVKKMPLGKLSKLQILKGLEALLEIEKEINGKCNRKTLESLTSTFYTNVPHSFGRSVPPVIATSQVLDQKKEMIMTLTDIEIAQSLQKEKAADDSIHPLEMKYNKLNCKLEHIDKKSDEFKMLHKYSTACPDTREGPLLDAWRVDRAGEASRFAAHDKIQNRKLLWHGTNVAVVAAILSSGMRIMPHSGGLVGRGIYFASEHAKSSWYVSPHHGNFEGEKDVGFMFLTEVALGTMNYIKQYNSSYKKAPPGFDSIVGRGNTEPNPKQDVKKTFDGKEVVVPLGKPTNQKEGSDSHFSKSEYLIYKESQARIRYLLKYSFK